MEERAIFIYGLVFFYSSISVDAQEVALLVNCIVRAVASPSVALSLGRMLSRRAPFAERGVQKFNLYSKSSYNHLFIFLFN